MNITKATIFDKRGQEVADYPDATTLTFTGDFAMLEIPGNNGRVKLIPIALDSVSEIRVKTA